MAQSFSCQSPLSRFLEERQLNLKDEWLQGARIVIGYHEGCVDGCAAAFMLWTAIQFLHPTAQVRTVPISHQKMRFAEPGLIEPGMVVFSVDITPTMEDIEALRRAAVAVLLDHHTSELETQAKLCEACPNVVNQSTSSGMDCAASMVFELVKDVCHFNRDVIHMVHKMDVFAHKLPKHLEEPFEGFKGYLTQNGERNINIDLVKNMFTDHERCIADGLERAALMISNTNNLAAAQEFVVDEANWRILYVKQLVSCSPIDAMHYQRKIDEKINGKPTLVLTHVENPLPNGLFNIGLRRAGQNLDISEVAREFKDKSEVVGGGGHPFAGGVQSQEFLTRAKVIELAIEVMTKLKS